MPALQPIRIFVDANFYTLRGLRKTRALAVAPTGHILAADTPRALRSLFPRAKVVSLDGATVLPGLTDSHMHFSAWCVQRSQVDLDGASSLHEALRRIERHAARETTEEWISGSGWNWNVWPEGRLPAAKDLDAILGPRPAAFMSKDWHTAWLNSRALSLLGITRDQGDVAGGTIERDAEGNPTGLVREAAAFFYMKRLPAPSPEAFEKAIGEGQRALRRLGITAVHAMETLDEFRALSALDAVGKLGLRVACYLPPAALDSCETLGLTSGYGVLRLKLAGIKLFGDGSLGSQTAFLLEPYEGTNHRGMMTQSREELLNRVTRAHMLGLSCAVHAIGDATVRMVLDIVESLGGHSPHSPRHRIEHCQLVHPQDVPRFGNLGVVASVQPQHCPSDMDLVAQHWGARGRHAYPFRSLARTGARLIFGSDAPVERPDPWLGIHAAVTRARPSDPRRIFHPEERLTRLAALQGYTHVPAWALREERLRGTLEPGRLADFIVLESDPFAVPTDELPKVRVAQTFIAGSAN